MRVEKPYVTPPAKSAVRAMSSHRRLGTGGGETGLGTMTRELFCLGTLMSVTPLLCIAISMSSSERPFFFRKAFL
jgi:hypothetical protein